MTVYCDLCHAEIKKEERKVHDLKNWKFWHDGCWDQIFGRPLTALLNDFDAALEARRKAGELG